MTEEDARAWVSARVDVPRETKLIRYVELLLAGNAEQNLVSPHTLATIWSRHIVDSAQLLAFAGPGTWMDIGSGAGLPGIVAAIMRDDPVILVEPRRKRAAFLEQCIATLALPNATVRMAKAAQVEDSADIISARAVGAIGQLFRDSSQCAHDGTIWVLPRGASGLAELAAVRKTWQGTFHVEQSITSPESAIVIARGVRLR